MKTQLQHRPQIRHYKLHERRLLILQPTRKIQAGETPAVTASGDDLVDVTDAQTGAPVQIPASSISGASVAAATTTTPGAVELATSAETLAGTDLVRAVTPSGLKSVTDAERATNNSTYQPLDPDLTAIAAVVTAPYGRGLLALTNVAGLRSSLTTGSYNTASGMNAQQALTTGSYNTASGMYAQSSLMTGNNNTASGTFASYNSGISLSTANALTTGSRNTHIGTQSGQNSATQRSYTVAVGESASVDGDYATAVGRATLAGAAGSVAVGVDSSGNAASTTTANDFRLGVAAHTVTALGKLALGGVGSFGGGGTGVVFLANAGTLPSSNPVGGGVLYADAGALKWRGSSGTVTTLANA